MLIALCIMFVCPMLSQDNLATRDASIKNGISKPTTLATHPFGMLFFTLPHNFKMRSNTVFDLDFQISSGNIWGQPIEVFVPTDESDRERMRSVIFYSRSQQFRPQDGPHEVYTFQYDGVVKDIRFSATMPLNQQSELKIGVRSFILTKGKFPFSGITGDQFIEFFHSNIAGGEDPFGRRVRGMDQARISYTDRQGNGFEISAGSFVLSGLESSYYFYPNWFQDQHVQINLGGHIGANLSSYNSSLDVGISLAAVKNFTPNKRSQFLTGLGLNFLRKKMVDFNNNHADLGTSSYFGSFEGHLEYSRPTRSGGHHSIGLNYRIQTPYNKKSEEDYYVPFSAERIARWHEAGRHLYKFPSYWSLIYSFTKKTEFSVYLQQDMLVNNAPDIQTGIRLRVPFIK